MTDQNTAPLDLDGLERLAKAATPGEWKRHYDEVRADNVKVIVDHDYQGLGVQHDPDLDHIAAANPATILALISQAREAERMRGAIRECRLADGHGARTGDESRWDRAFHNLCALEKPAPATGGGDA